MNSTSDDTEHRTVQFSTDAINMIREAAANDNMNPSAWIGRVAARVAEHRLRMKTEADPELMAWWKLTNPVLYAPLSNKE